MNRLFYTLCFLAITSFLDAQTWTGNTSTDWNTATNWSGGAVPLPAGNVTIPTAPDGNRWPVLATNVTINSLIMAAGSQINVNGKSITAGSIDLRASFSNSDGASDINIILTGSATSFVRNSSFSDHVIYTINGTATLYDTYQAGTANSYTGNVSYQRTGAGTSWIGYYSRNQYGGNVSINHSVAANLSAFEAGADITGNLNVTQAGNSLVLGSTANATNIAGTLTVNASVSGPVDIFRLINQTTGGSISLQDRATVNIARDTIKVTSLTSTGQTAALEFNFNDLTGNLSVTGAASLSGSSFLRSNTVKGNASFTLNGTGTLYDTYQVNTANSYTGNVSYQRNGTGTSWIGYYGRNQYGGNVTINNTVAANLSAFEAGADIGGNVNVNHVGGSLTLGTTANATNIAGTITVNASVSGPVDIFRLINQTTGGSISLQDRATVNIARDTIRVTSLTSTGQTAALDFNFNDLTGNLSLTGAASLTGTSYLRSNLVKGTASFTLNGTGTLYDSYQVNTANSYTGNVSYQRNGAGTSWIGYYGRNQYGGNVTINNTVAANLSAFEAGADIGGNVNVNHVGGSLTLGTTANATNIAGMLTVNASVSGLVEFFRLINQTTGGSINLQDRSTTSIVSDTIKVNNFVIVGQTGALDLRTSSLTGNFDFSGAKTLTATSFVRNSIVTGNASYTLKGTGTFYDTYQANTRNTYTGNLSYLRDSTGPLYVGYYDTVSIGGNLVFKYSLPGTVDNRYLAFQSSGNSSISQLGTIPLQFERLSMKKTGNATLTLMDSVRINNQVYFNGGNIITANQKELIWLNSSNSITPTDSSHVVGPVVKIGAQAFKFPVGSATDLQAVVMTVPSGTTTRFRAQYFLMNPHPTYDTSQRATGLAAISGCEYWKVDREIGTTNVTLTFDYGGPCLCVEVPADLRVARWSGSQWSNLGNGATTGDKTGGTVQTAAAVTDYGIFSLGTSAVVPPSVSISRDVNNPVCVCRRVTFTATPGAAGCNPSYQWKKNNLNVGTNSNEYSDSALVNGDIITVVITSSAAFASPKTQVSNSFNITTTDLTTWTGATNTNWHLGSNWSCNSVPCILSKVTVPGGTPNNCEILSGNVQVISLTANGGGIMRVLNGSTFTLKLP